MRNRSLFASPAFAQTQSLAVLGSVERRRRSAGRGADRCAACRSASDADYRVSSSHVSLSQMTMAQRLRHHRGAVPLAHRARARGQAGDLRRAAARSRRAYEVELHMFASAGTASAARRSIPKGETEPHRSRPARARAVARARGQPEPKQRRRSRRPRLRSPPDVKPLGAKKITRLRRHTRDHAPQASRGSNDWTRLHTARGRRRVARVDRFLVDADLGARGTTRTSPPTARRCTGEAERSRRL